MKASDSFISGNSVSTGGSITSENICEVKEITKKLLALDAVLRELGGVLLLFDVWY